MTKTQRKLARHALGLTQPGWHQSYRNRFFAGPKHPDYANWRAMVNAGLAMRVPWAVRHGDLFLLTRTGAESALRQGERLDPEDFPNDHR